MLMAGETLNIFLLTGIPNINIFFVKKKNNLAVNSNICGKFASKILNYNVKKTYPKDPRLVPYPLATLKCSHALTSWT